ncbi:MAG: hypothetical protein QGD94_10740, partial [Planctomycetia bacterium]|nr:hypothetical protein [Planctomycetia bacterium]
LYKPAVLWRTPMLEAELDRLAQLREHPDEQVVACPAGGHPPFSSCAFGTLSSCACALPPP